MMFLTEVLFLIYMISVLSPLSPVKFSVTLIFLSLILFCQVYALNSSAWIGSVIFMIFVGGVMIMFMVLSSLLPNEKNMKNKKIMMFSLAIIFFSGVGSMSNLHSESVVHQGSKILFFSNQSFEVLMMMILMYFFSFLLIITKENFALRTMAC